MLTIMNSTNRTVALLAASMLLAACGSMRRSVVVEPAAGRGYPHYSAAPQLPARATLPGAGYIVRKGDTLYSIAFRNGVDFRSLAQWNAIAAPYTIWPGQRLKLSPAASPARVATVVRNPAPPSSAAHPLAAASATTAAPVFAPVVAPAASAGRTGVASGDGAGRTAAAAPSAVVPVAGVPTPPPVTLHGPMPAATLAAGASRVIDGVKWRWPAQGSVFKRFQSGDAIPGIEIAGNSGDPVRAAADGVVVYSGNGLVGYGELVIIKHSDTFLSAYGHNRKRLVREGERVSAGQPIAEMGSTGAARNELEFQIRKDGNPVDPMDYLPPR